MKLTSNRDKTQAELVLEKFNGKKTFSMISTPAGEIISIETTDKEVQEFVKKLGLSKDG